MPGHSGPPAPHVAALAGARHPQLPGFVAVVFFFFLKTADRCQSWRSAASGDEAPPSPAGLGPGRADAVAGDAGKAVRAQPSRHPAYRHLAAAGPLHALAVRARRKVPRSCWPRRSIRSRRRSAQADVVLLHFWSTPRLWRLLVSSLPAARYMLWSKTMGEHAPQLLNAALLSGVQAWAFTAPPPAHLVDRVGPAPVIPGLVDRPEFAVGGERAGIRLC